MVANARYYGHLQSAYTTFAFLPTSSPMYSSLVGGISKDAAGNPKLYSQNGVTPLLSLDPFATVALDEYQKLKNIGLNSVYWDVESYGSIGPSPFGNPLTEDASSPAAKVHRDGYAVKKKFFKAARDLLAGPMLGEGSFADRSSRRAAHRRRSGSPPNPQYRRLRRNRVSPPTPSLRLPLGRA